MRYLFGFLCVCALGVVPKKKSAAGGRIGNTKGASARGTTRHSI